MKSNDWLCESADGTGSDTLIQVDEDIQVIVRHTNDQDSLERAKKQNPKWFKRTSPLVLAGGRHHNQALKQKLTSNDEVCCSVYSFQENALSIVVKKETNDTTAPVALKPKKRRPVYRILENDFNKTNLKDVKPVPRLKKKQQNRKMLSLNELKIGGTTTSAIKSPSKQILDINLASIIAQPSKQPSNTLLDMIDSSSRGIDKKTAPILIDLECDNVISHNVDVKKSEISASTPVVINSVVEATNNLVEAQQTRTVPKKGMGREMEQLYVSLKEIPWAQDWNPDNIITKRSTRQNSVDGRITRLTDNIPIKKPVKYTSEIGGETIRHKTVSKNGKTISPTASEAAARKKSSPTGSNKSASARPSLKRKLSPAIAAKKKISPPRITNGLAYLQANNKKNKNGALKTVPSITNNNNKRKRFKAIRFDFINKSTSNDKLKKTVQSKAAKILNKSKSLPEVKVKLEQLDRNALFESNGSPISFMGGHVKFGDNAKLSNGSKHGDASKFKYNFDVINPTFDHCIQQQIGQIIQDSTNDSESDLESQKSKKRRLDEEETQRFSIRQSEYAYRYKEIAVKKHVNFIQFILVPSNNQKSLTLEGLRELRESLISAKKDTSCKLVLINGTGNIFCTGLDLRLIVGPERIKNVDKLANAIKDLAETLALFTKPIVAAVNGLTMGLGVSLLTYCDVVFASDKATFCMPYAKLGHIPEAGATLLLPQVVGSITSSNMLLRGQNLTALQANTCGLVNEVIWPTLLMENVIPKVQKMACQSLQAMEVTKMMLRSHQMERLKIALENETRILPKQWLSPSCQKAVNDIITSGGFSD